MIVSIMPIIPSLLVFAVARSATGIEGGSGVFIVIHPLVKSSVTSIKCVGVLVSDLEYISYAFS